MINILNRLFVLGCLIAFLPHAGSAQDKILLQKGKVLEGKILRRDDVFVDLKRSKLKGFEVLKVENYRIFSLIDSSGVETILYEQDSTMGNFLNVENMRMFVTGEMDSYKNFRPTGTKILSFGIALGLSLFDTYKRDTLNFTQGFFRSEPGIIHFVSPFVITAASGIPPISIRITDLSNRNYLSSESYIEGFKRVSKIQRLFGSLKFSLIGSATGLGMYYLVNAVR